jgi:hypothetical protein
MVSEGAFLTKQAPLRGVSEFVLNGGGLVPGSPFPRTDSARHPTLQQITTYNRHGVWGIVVSSADLMFSLLGQRTLSAKINTSKPAIKNPHRVKSPRSAFTGPGSRHGRHMRGAGG